MLSLTLIDDWGLAPMGDPERRDILEVTEERYGTGAIIVTSQLPVKNWHGYIGDGTIADAIMDRLTPKAHRIELSGESMRNPKNRLRKDKDEE